MSAPGEGQPGCDGSLIILPVGNEIQQLSEKPGLLIQPFVPFNLCPCHQDPDPVAEAHTTVNVN